MTLLSLTRKIDLRHSWECLRSYCRAKIEKSDSILLYFPLYTIVNQSGFSRETEPRAYMCKHKDREKREEFILSSWLYDCKSSSPKYVGTDRQAGNSERTSMLVSRWNSFSRKPQFLLLMLQLPTHNIEGNLL